MSTFTQKWTENKIRDIIQNLDEKTGLNGAELPISFFNSGRALGKYRYVEPKAFLFNRKFFNDPNTKEAEVIDVIRHEYAHYYDDVLNLKLYIRCSPRAKSHGADWKWACKMVGADPTRCHNTELFANMEWNLVDAIDAYNAEDVEAFDIRSFIKKWGQVPVDKEIAERMTASLKAQDPNAYYKIGDEVLHPTRGFGIVIDMIPYTYDEQKVYVQFEDQTLDRFLTSLLYKMVNGTAVSFRKN